MHQLTEKVSGSIQVAWTNLTYPGAANQGYSECHPRQLAPNLLRQRNGSRRYRLPRAALPDDARCAAVLSKPAHSRAYSHLLYGLSQREGFVVVTGEVGAGKTTLIERLCAEFATKGHAMARVMTTQVDARRAAAPRRHRLRRPGRGRQGGIAAGHHRCVCAEALLKGAGGTSSIVDEAQALPVASLEELRMLSNVTEGAQALLQVLLLGQPQLRHTLARPDLDQLRQRILAAYHLAGLTREETHLYVRHRMTSVGWTGLPPGRHAALDLVHEHTGGIPRRINRLCARVLLAGSLEHATVLTAELVEASPLRN